MKFTPIITLVCGAGIRTFIGVDDDKRYYIVAETKDAITYTGITSDKLNEFARVLKIHETGLKCPFCNQPSDGYCEECKEFTFCYKEFDGKVCVLEPGHKGGCIVRKRKSPLPPFHPDYKIPTNPPFDHDHPAFGVQV